MYSFRLLRPRLEHIRGIVRIRREATLQGMVSFHRHNRPISRGNSVPPRDSRFQPHTCAYCRSHKWHRYVSSARVAWRCTKHHGLRANLSFESKDMNKFGYLDASIVVSSTQIETDFARSQ